MRHIVKCWATTTPESAALGDHAARGNDGTVWTEREVEDGMVLSSAVAFLREQGVSQTSSSRFHFGMWYSTGSVLMDPMTGQEQEDTFHLYGFDVDDERAIAASLAKETRVHL